MSNHYHNGINIISKYKESEKMYPLITYIQRKKNLIIVSDGSKSNKTLGGAWITATEEGE